MKAQARKTLRLADLIQVISSCSGNEHETAMAVADLVNRQVVKIHGRYRRYRVVIR